MTIAIISDIHANLPALEAVLADIGRRRIDMLFCLGDLVGYAPWPNEVVAMIRARNIPTIAGNYDEGVGRNSGDCGCAYKTDEDKARGNESIVYTNTVVRDDTREYLRHLPRQMRLEFGTGREKISVLMVHGSPRKINEYLFEERPDQSLHRMMADAHADVMLFGHTHKPFHKVLPYEAEGTPRYRHAINTGSVGKPKDGDPRACYLLLGIGDATGATPPGNIRAEFIRVPYDVEKAARGVEESPLPDTFAEMLRKGE